jgi:transcriptional regulator with XRE-family HTH domain
LPKKDCRICGSPFHIDTAALSYFNEVKTMRPYSRIRAFREDKDWSQAKIAEMLHCSQRIYSNYERGDVDIPTEILRQLAVIHDTSADYLLELTDDPTPYPRKK